MNYLAFVYVKKHLSILRPFVHFPQIVHLQHIIPPTLTIFYHLQIKSCTLRQRMSLIKITYNNGLKNRPA